MRLSEAIMLGASTCKMIPRNWDSCALGAAANAVGIPKTKWRVDPGSRTSFADPAERIEALDTKWPWLLSPSNRLDVVEWIYRHEITQRFDSLVCYGHMTLEQLVDYVRSVEPPETEEVIPTETVLESVGVK